MWNAKWVDIQRSEFLALDGPRKLIWQEEARRYAGLFPSPSGGMFGLAWSSDLVDPIVIAPPDDGSLWVGVDRCLIALEPSTSRIVLSLRLDTNLLQVRERHGIVAIATELGLMVFNCDLSIRRMVDVPDLVDQVDLEESRIVVRLVDGRILEFGI